MTSTTTGIASADSVDPYKRLSIPSNPRVRYLNADRFLNIAFRYYSGPTGAVRANLTAALAKPTPNGPRAFAGTAANQDSVLKYAETSYDRQTSILFQTFRMTSGYVGIGYSINAGYSALSPRANDVINYGTVARTAISTGLDTMGFLANINRWQARPSVPDRNLSAPETTRPRSFDLGVIAFEPERMAGITRANAAVEYDTNLKITRFNYLRASNFDLAANAAIGIGLNIYIMQQAGPGDKVAYQMAAIQMGSMISNLTGNVIRGVGVGIDIRALQTAQQGRNVVDAFESSVLMQQSTRLRATAKSYAQFSAGFALIHGVLSIAQLIPAAMDADTAEQKGVIAAEMLAQVVGGALQEAFNARLAVNLARGLTEASAMATPALGAVASALMLSVSPLDIYALNQEGVYRNALAKLGRSMEASGYAGDTMLSNLWTDRIDMETATLANTTALSLVGALVEVVAIMGGPITLGAAATVTLIASVAGGILKAVQQPELESIARTYIKAIKAQGGAKAYFHSNLQAQYNQITDTPATQDYLRALQSDYQAGQVIGITTVKLSRTAIELAAITRNAARISTADIFINSFVNGYIQPNNSLSITNNLTTGLIDITGTASGSNQLLTFLTPLMTPGAEQRVRTKTGSNSFKTSVDILYTGTGWTINDAGANTTMDLRMMASHLYDSNHNLIRDVPVFVHTGAGDDTVIMGSADTTVGSTRTTLDPSDPSSRPDAGFDTVSYQGLAAGTSVAVVVNADGSITVNKTVAGASVYNEVDGWEKVSNDKVAYGTRIETVAVRDVVVSKVENIKATDTLYHVGRVIGSVGNDTMTGGAGADNLMGGAGDDLLNGGAGDDTLAGGNGADTLSGGGGMDTADFRDTDSGVGMGVYVHLSSLAFDNATQPVMVAPKSTAVWVDMSQVVKAPISDANMVKFAGHAVVADMWDPAHPNQFYGNMDQLSGIENIWGSLYADRIEGDEQGNYLWGADGNDLIRGGDGDDVLDGGTGSDMLFGQNGNDTLLGSEGADTLDGGDSFDTLDYSNNPNTSITAVGVTVNLTTGQATDWSGNLDVLRNIENVVGTEKADNLIGNAGANLLNGVGGADVLQGMDGDDTLMGGSSGELYGQSWGANSGNDWATVSDNGNDTADFSGNPYGAYGISATLDTGLYPGYDVVDAATGKVHTVGRVVENPTAQATDPAFNRNATFLYQIENLTGTAYADQLTGDAGANVLLGGAGNDTISGGAGDDTIDGGAGDNSLAGGAGDDYFFFGADVDTGGMRIDTIDGGDGFNTLDFSELSGKWASGIDLDLGTSSTDSVPAGSTQFVVRSTVAGTSSLRIAATVANIQNVVGSAVNDRIAGDGADNILVGMEGNDYVAGGGGDDLIAGGLGNDTLDGGTGSDTLMGGAGNDLLQGGLGADVLIGGQGSDAINGGGGSDTIDYSNDPGATLGIWANLNPNATGAILVYENWDASTQAQTGTGIDTLSDIENIIGTNYSDKFEGDANANRIDAGAGDDWIRGGGGGDTLNGGDGDDQFVQAAAAGNSTIDGGTGVNSIEYSGIALNTTPGALGANVRYGISANLASGRVVKLARADDVTGAGIDSISNIAAIQGTNIADHLVGDANLNYFSGDAGDDLMDGAAGNDTLNGGDGSDTLYGGSGDDFLSGGAGADLLNGGVGNDQIAQDIERVNDTIDGGSGNDILDYSLTDFGTGPRSDMGTVGIYANLAAGTVEKFHGLSTSGPQGIDRISGIEALVGTQFNDSITGSAGTDVLDGSAGNDSIDGAVGNDVLFGGAGADLLFGGDGDDTFMQDMEAVNDTIDGGSGADTLDYTLTQFLDPRSATISISVDLGAGATTKTSKNDTVNTDTFSNIENVNGSSLDDRLIGSASNNVLNGTAGSDTIFGMAGDDTMDGGIDDDVLFGGSGADSIFGNDGNDIIMQDMEAVSDTIDGGDGEDTVDYSVTQFANQSRTAYGVNGIQADLNTGTVVKFVIASGGPFVDRLSNIEDITGSMLNDSIAGDANANVLSGGLGSDTIRAGAGADIVVQNIAREKDTLDGGDGTDMLDYSANTFAAGSRVSAGGRGITVDLTRSRVDKYEVGATDAFDTVTNFEDITGTSLADSITGSTDDNWLAGREGNDTLIGAGGNDLLDGGDGDDSLQGSSGNDILDGGHGNDTLVGAGGTDIFRFDLGDGVDLIRESATSTTDRDVLSFGPEIGIAQLWFKRVKDNLEISVLGTSDKVTVENWYKGASYQLESIQTQVGMVLVPPQVDVLVAAMAKVKQATLDSGMPAAVVTAITSAWQLDSVARHVIGSDLADTLGGGNGDDVFDGGGGNDDLRGNGGDDFFLQSLSTDSDSIDGGSGVNTVSYMGPDSYGSGISADLDAGRVDKLAAVGSQAASFDTLTNINNVIGSMGDDALFGNDRANGLDGSTGDDSLYGGAGDDTVLGGNGKDVLNGGTGNDILNGGAGADLYIFNAGDGSDTVTDNDATPNVTDQIYFGSGITADKLWFQHVGNDLLVSVIGTTDSVSVVDWYNGAAYQIEQFRAAGSLLLGSDVNSLVAAMAAFTPPVLGQATLPANYSPLTAARQAAWHTAP